MASSYSKHNNTGVKVTKQNMADVLRSVRLLTDVEVLVGVPEDKTVRDPALAMHDGDSITNAALAYIHDQGSPEAHIPQREFMRPGIRAAQEDIAERLGAAMRGAMRGNEMIVEQSLIQVGQVAADAIRNKIDEGIAPALSDYTVRKRAERGRKGALQEMDNRMAGMSPSLDLAKPLVDTGEMRKSISYAIRSRKKRET